MSAPSIADIKETLAIPEAWQWLNLPGAPGKCCASPFRPDKSPSFSVYADGKKWRDHATAEGGDLLDFIARALDRPLPEAIAWARERMGHAPPLPQPAPSRPAASAVVMPALREGTAKELRALSELRGIRAEALATAQRAGLLRFTEHRGRVAWCITDNARRIVEGRRLDGQLWPGPRGVPGHKCHAWGSGKTWPVNVDALGAADKVAFCEGAPDLLAAVALIEREEATSVCAVTLLGAGNGIAAEALPAFRGKVVRLYPHADSKGLDAARRWALALRDAGAVRVDAFDFSGLTLTDGTPGKDLNDFLRCGADAWESYSKFRNPILP